MNKNVLKLRKDFLALADIPTDKGVLVVEGDLAVGKEVMIEEEGEWVPAPDGEYAAEDRIIVVEAGVIIEIREPENEILPEPEPEPEPEEEPITEPTDEVQQEDEEPIEEPAEEPEAEDAEKDAYIAELEARVAELEAENAELKAKLDEAEVALKASAAKPAKEEFKTMEKKPLFKTRF